MRRLGTRARRGDVVADGRRRRRRRRHDARFKFGGSWVFLYPLPFHGAGEWGELDGVLLRARCCSSGSRSSRGASRSSTPCSGRRCTRSKHEHLQPPRRRARLRLRLAEALRDEPAAGAVPVIPLTVIAIDMIIATLPLAVLLVEMIVQSISPERDRRPAAREERALVLRPPGRLPAALPGGRDLLPARPALRGARRSWPATSSPSPGRSPSSRT